MRERLSPQTKGCWLEFQKTGPLPGVRQREAEQTRGATTWVHSTRSSAGNTARALAGRGPGLAGGGAAPNGRRRGPSEQESRHEPGGEGAELLRECWGAHGSREDTPKQPHGPKAAAPATTSLPGPRSGRCGSGTPAARLKLSQT